jgi:uncharacterized membrane protein YcjF (UPF0283 family)
METSNDMNPPNHSSKYIEESEVFVDDDDDDNDEDKEVFDVDDQGDAQQQQRRDEVGEVRKMSSKDTNRLRLWRWVVTGVLLLTAFAVTFTTYTLLEQQEDKNFQTAVRVWFVYLLILLLPSTMQNIISFHQNTVWPWKLLAEIHHSEA